MLDNGELVNGNVCHVAKTEVKDRLNTNGIKHDSGSLNKRSLWDSWLRSYGLKPKAETAECYHESFILHGYRPTPSSVLYCVKSLFHPTNETLNVWTHLIPFVIAATRHFKFANEIMTERGYTDPLFYPYWFFVLGVVLTFFGSSLAHTFNCLTPGAREACFCCDYGCIAIQCIGLATCFTFYICPYTCVIPHTGSYHLAYFAIIVGSMMAVPIVCYSRLPYVPYRYVLRIAVYVVLYTSLCLPCFYKYLTFTPEPQFKTCGIAISDESRRNFFELTCIMALSATVNGLRFPERILPGWFDIVGHSHQIFHVLIAGGLYYQNKFIEGALREILGRLDEGTLSVDDLNITWYSAFLFPAMNGLISMVLTFVFSVVLCRRQNLQFGENCQKNKSKKAQ
nr:membrane progestin receptor gamma-A-like [Ciona intestinalis]|eukprot:XP_002125627.4 membrane progestin receptor gamma-A-like [Ciona intestinalis]